MLNRITAFTYGVACYILTLATFIYAAGFLGDFGVPKPIDAAPQTTFFHALAVNCLLLAIFSLQHSVMARPWFKAAWTRIVPVSVERSTYLLFSCAAMFLLFWKWEPMGGTIWNAENPYVRMGLYATYASGWLLVLLATFLLNHFDLFGLRQVWLRLRGLPYTGLRFGTPGVYRFVRHPLYVGWLMVFWSAPKMTSAHMVFALLTTVYILAAIQFEERDLIKAHGEYAEYRKRVPMLIPIGSSSTVSDNAGAHARAVKQAS